MKSVREKIALAIIIVILWMAWGPKWIRGQVVEDISSIGIEGVRVEALRRGWGVSHNGLVWDKDYDRTTTTDHDGRFFFLYFRGGISVHLRFSKPGYISTNPTHPLQDVYAKFWDVPTTRLRRLEGTHDTPSTR